MNRRRIWVFSAIGASMEPSNAHLVPFRWVYRFQLTIMRGERWRPVILHLLAIYEMKGRILKRSTAHLSLICWAQKSSYYLGKDIDFEVWFCFRKRCCISHQVKFIDLLIVRRPKWLAASERLVFATAPSMRMLSQLALVLLLVGIEVNKFLLSW